MSFILSPNMNLPIPGVGTEPGPNYAQDLNSALTLIDSHDHSPGYGVQITPAGLNINASLDFNDNLAINVAGVTLTSQSSTPGINTIYESGDDLFFVDGVGNDVRITQNGAVAGAPGSIANLVSPASASYVSLSSSFVWQSNTNIAANMDFGAAIMRNLTPNSIFALTLQPPAALSSNYSITLPTLPVSSMIMTIDSTGTIRANTTVDNSTIVISSNIIQVPASGIGTTQLADQSVTKAKQAAMTTTLLATAGNMAVAPDVSPIVGSSFGTTSASAVPVTENDTVTITIASPAVITFAPGQFNPQNGVPVTFTTTGALPTGIAAGTTYYLINIAGPSAGNYTANISTTIGGSAVNTSGSQSGVHTVHLQAFAIQIVTTGRPVRINLTPLISHNLGGSVVQVTTTGGGSGVASGTLSVARTGTSSATLTSIAFRGPNRTGTSMQFQANGFSWIDAPAAGTYQYTLLWSFSQSGTTDSFSIQGCSLTVYEI